MLYRTEFIDIMNSQYDMGLDNMVGVNDVRYRIDLNGVESDSILDHVKNELRSFFKLTFGRDAINYKFNDFEILNRVKDHSVSFNYHDLYDIFLDNNNLSVNSVTLYRLENESENKGLYVSSIGESLKGYYNPNHQPSPLEDSRLKSIFYDLEDREGSQKWFFAFSEINDVKDWLGCGRSEYFEVLKILEREGVKLVSYHIDQTQVLNSGRQACFVLSKAERGESRLLLECLGEEGVQSRPNIRKSRRI